MMISAKYWSLLPIGAGIAGAIVIAVHSPADAQSSPCVTGYVPRLAAPNDMVCVTQAVASRTQQENANAAQNRDPNGAYGPSSCKQGFVWREAFNGDTVCVTPDIREQTWADNAAAQSRKAAPLPTEAAPMPTKAIPIPSDFRNPPNPPFIPPK